MLLCDELREGWRWEGLSACHGDGTVSEFDRMCLIWREMEKIEGR